MPAGIDLGVFQGANSAMIEATSIRLPREELAEFCRRYQVRELALFGSALRPDYRPDSDVDLLVTFAPAARVTFLTLAQMQRELAAMVGCNVDLIPKEGLKPAIRDHVLATARVLYAA
jgi:uncharacterized protein